jgi:tetrapyrrole methylase family protein / MazG family protein
MTISIVGLGAGDVDQLTLGVYRTLREAEHLYLRTKEHPVVASLEEEGIRFISFDDVYEKYETFDEVYEEISRILLEEAETKDIVYAVPGHPIVAERTVQLLLQKGREKNISVQIGGGQSFIDALCSAVKLDPIEGFQLLDGTSLKRDDVKMNQHVIIGQVYDSFVASEVKLTLMEKYPDDYEVYIVTAAGTAQEKVQKIQLYELDRQVSLNNLTSVYVPPVKEKEGRYKDFYTFREIVAELRGPNGCPWDKEQTHQSLKKYLIEEAYELLDAIDADDVDHMIEELGDVLLQVLLHAQIGEDDGLFSIEDVIESIGEKMVRRHPHVFSTVKVEDADEVVNNWNAIKAKEKGTKKEESILSSIPKGLPALFKAYEMQKKAAKVGFDWEDVDGAWEKVQEELDEWKGAIQQRNEQEAAKEFGDVLFALVNVARFYRIHPEDALQATVQKFQRRFEYVEQQVKASGRSFDQFSLEELDQFWNEAKAKGY